MKVRGMHKVKALRMLSRRNHESKKEGKYQESIQSSSHLTQDTNWKVITSQLDITNESQEASPFQARDHKASINRRERKHKKCYLNMSGVQFFRLQLNRNLTQFMPSGIHCQPDSTERNCSLKPLLYAQYTPRCTYTPGV